MAFDFLGLNSWILEDMSITASSLTAPMLALVVVTLMMMYAVTANTMVDSSYEENFAEDQEFGHRLGGMRDSVDAKRDSVDAKRDSVDAKRSEFLQALAVRSGTMKRGSLQIAGLDAETNLEEPFSIKKRQQQRSYYACPVNARLENLTSARDNNDVDVEIVQDTMWQTFFVVECIEVDICCRGVDASRYKSECMQGTSNIMAHVFKSKQPRVTEYKPIQVKTRCYCKLTEIDN